MTWSKTRIGEREDCSLTPFSLVPSALGNHVLAFHSGRGESRETGGVDPLTVKELTVVVTERVRPSVSVRNNPNTLPRTLDVCHYPTLPTIGHTFISPSTGSGTDLRKYYVNSSVFYVRSSPGDTCSEVRFTPLGLFIHLLLVTLPPGLYLFLPL